MSNSESSAMSRIEDREPYVYRGPEYDSRKESNPEEGNGQCSDC